MNVPTGMRSARAGETNYIDQFHFSLSKGLRMLEKNDLLKKVERKN
jgi:hypothetical protein